jgi:hypothetical protein
LSVSEICRPVYLWQRREGVANAFVFYHKITSLFAAAATECAVNILVCSQEPAGPFISGSGGRGWRMPLSFAKNLPACQPAQ